MNDNLSLVLFGTVFTGLTGVVAYIVSVSVRLGHKANNKDVQDKLEAKVNKDSCHISMNKIDNRFDRIDERLLGIEKQGTATATTVNGLEQTMKEINQSFREIVELNK